MAETGSTLSASVRVPREVLEGVARDLLPKKVAEGRSVPAGVAGRASFQIERNEPRLEITNREIAVDVDLHGDIRLCKPFGPVCVEYGRCRPEWHGRLTIDLPWRLDETPDVELDVGVTRGCTLSPVKVDATRELERVTREEVTKIRRQVRRAVKKYHDELLPGAGRIVLPGGLFENTPFDFEVNELAIGWVNADTDYRLNVRISGNLDDRSTRQNIRDGQVREHNVASVTVSRDARLVALDEGGAPTHLAVTERFPFTELERYWETRLNQKLTVQPAGSGLLVSLSPWESCGTGWVLLQPQLNAGGTTLVATQTSHDALTGFFPVPERLAERALAQLESVRQLNESFPRSLRFDPSGTKPLHLELSPTLKPTQTIASEPDALVLSSAMKGEIQGTLKH